MSSLARNERSGPSRDDFGARHPSAAGNRTTRLSGSLRRSENHGDICPYQALHLHHILAPVADSKKP